MNKLPESYYLAVGLCFIHIIFAIINRKQAWALPFGAVVATVGGWYLVEPVYFPELFETFRFEMVEKAYYSVCLFYVALIFTTPTIAKQMRPSSHHLSIKYVSADKLLVMVAGTWIILLAYGTYRMNGDLLGALYPVDGRAGGRMWSREAGAGAGSGGFIVSTASYLYVLCLASFGLLIFFVKKKASLACLTILIVIAWPYSFLQGSRNITLATIAPGGLAFLLFGRIGMIGKTLVTLTGAVVLDFLMRVIIEFRNTGFGDIDFSKVEKTSHLGLNMGSELVYITSFLDDKTLTTSNGMRYLTEISNVVPRAIWADKPLIGIDYAIARSFGGNADSDIGVFATISSGLVGQGVLNFGNVLGPIAAAALMALWIGFLARLRLQNTPLRLALYLVGLGVTFNLGRDITLLVLWPIVFGYLGVRMFEYNEQLGKPQIGQN
jgi:hypothetical protein